MGSKRATASSCSPTARLSRAPSSSLVRPRADKTVRVQIRYSGPDSAHMRPSEPDKTVRDNINRIVRANDAAVACSLFFAGAHPGTRETVRARLLCTNKAGPDKTIRDDTNKTVRAHGAAVSCPLFLAAATRAIRHN